MIARIRIYTGLVLFVFAALHLANLGFGLISVQAIMDNTWWLMALFFNPVGGSVLTASFLIHGILGLEAIYRRNTFRMTRLDTVQFASSLAIVPLLVPHIVGTSIAGSFYGITPTYPVILQYFWVDVPLEGLRQVIVLAVVWVHGCIGLFTWLRLRSWWVRVAPFIYPLAVALPVAALLGFVEAGKAAVDGTLPPVYDFIDPDGPPIGERLAALDRIKWWAIGIFAVMVAGTLIARYARLREYTANAQVDYGEGYRFAVPTGRTLLEIATTNDVPHARLCRGRGRCGSCQVRIVENELPLPAPTLEEVQTLTRVGAPEDARLACRTKPGGGHIRIERLVPPDVTPTEFFGTSEKKQLKPDTAQAEGAS